MGNFSHSHMQTMWKELHVYNHVLFIADKYFPLTKKYRITAYMYIVLMLHIHTCTVCLHVQYIVYMHISAPH